MEEKDFQRIEKIIVGMMGKFREEIVEEFRHQMSIQREDSQHKLDLVVEGQQALVEKLETTGAELKSEIAKVDQRVITLAVDH